MSWLYVSDLQEGLTGEGYFVTRYGEGMNLLVLTKDYPRTNGTHERMYVHVRDLYYAKQGLNVTVLNFACNHDYEIDGIRVITKRTYESEKRKYDIAVSHASNLRNHYVFLKQYANGFSHIVFFFHGHEVLRLNESYPKPYSYVKRKWLRNFLLQNAYDSLKLYLWKRYFRKLSYKSEFVFVSHWIYHQFRKNIGSASEYVSSKCHIINNSIASVFEREKYDMNHKKIYDFITIRSNLDGSKYGVDLVMKLAQNKPEAKFLLIGRGKYFDHNVKPDNVEWVNRTLNHTEMIDYLNQSKCGLLLTREDTQGVMTCEMAAFGMPVITSDIEVCDEFFRIMPNVAMIPNDEAADIQKISADLSSGLPYPKDTTYFAGNTIEKEIELFRSIV